IQELEKEKKLLEKENRQLNTKNTSLRDRIQELEKEKDSPTKLNVITSFSSPDQEIPISNQKLDNSVYITFNGNVPLSVLPNQDINTSSSPNQELSDSLYNTTNETTPLSVLPDEDINTSWFNQGLNDSLYNTIENTPLSLNQNLNTFFTMLSNQENNTTCISRNVSLSLDQNPNIFFINPLFSISSPNQDNEMNTSSPSQEIPYSYTPLFS
ncbi:11637_t:CDS:1, partial [Ambispora gerdemannii]